MPDWFYRTVSQPLLFRLPAVAARDLALGFMGSLARLPFGRFAIDFLGHMSADPRLLQTIHGIDFPTRVGLGPYLDGAAAALPALARFGFGFLEIGPVTLAGSVSAQPLARRPNEHAIWLPDPPESLCLDAVKPRVAEASHLGLPLIVRLGFTLGETPEQSATECKQLIHALAVDVDVFCLLALRQAATNRWSPEQWADYLRIVLDAASAHEPRRLLLLCVEADAETDSIMPFIDAGLSAGVAGFLIDGSIQANPSGRLVGLPAHEMALERVRYWRRHCGAGVLLIGSGGVHEPEHALALLAAGADLVQVDTGLVYSGPGLPKRINESLLFEKTQSIRAPKRTERAPEMTWFWTALMGAGMLLGSLLALMIAATRVVLAYDEAFVGMTRNQLAATNPRLLAFMTHDRISLAGTMIAIGTMYVGLSLFGVRRGLHWARQAIFTSAFTGFASFFLFLGFGYLDTFHAFVTAVLLQLLLLGVHARLGTYVPAAAPSIRGDLAWRWGLWGQLLLVFHGFALLGAGTTISTIGVTQVFVPEDLQFMNTTAEALRAANPRLVPLIAHDRATFGGMLLSSGWIFLLPALWGFRNGSAWLWWTMLISGVPAYAAAIGVHYAVGYTHLMHLLPAFSGFGIFAIGLTLSYSFLCRNN